MHIPKAGALQALGLADAQPTHSLPSINASLRGGQRVLV
jgi:hypothetical protein